MSVPGREVFVLSERARGLFEDPNVFGPFMVVPALIVASELLEPRLLRVGRAVKVALFVVLGAGVLFSVLACCWLNAAVAFSIMIVVYALRRGGGRRVFRLLFTVVTALALLAVALAVTGSVAFLEERARFQTYDVERFGAQQTGIGLGTAVPVRASGRGSSSSTSTSRPTASTCVCWPSKASWASSWGLRS